jgi:hypothetical protein
MSQSPEVLDGLRAPRTVRLEEARARQTDSPEQVQATPVAGDGTVYVSKYRRYRVQVTAPSDIVDPYTGRKQSGGKSIVAEFDENVYRNNTKDKSLRRMIDEALQANPYFGKFGQTADFWLLSDQNAQVEKRKLAQATATLKAMPKEVLDAYIESIKQGTAEDHDLSAK